uniref:Vacuolar fusion protein MON1 homolog n=1 Tax=Heterorhabditis bacteriophora TaxID=37862 RepID=A0A1I7XS23_HETBA
MNEIEAPGESSAADISTFNQSTTNVSVTQIELEDDDTDIIPISEDCVLDKLAEYPYQVFVLSEYGRPIFVSNNRLKSIHRYMESCVSSWRADISLFQSAIRIIPMQPSDRDYLSSTMSSCISAAKLDGVLFGLMIAHRQIATIVRLKRYVIHPRDTHILINLITGNSSLQISEAQTWTPICLPYFNDSGFMYAYIAFPWEGSAACLILLSVKKDHFDPLNDVIILCIEVYEKYTNTMLDYVNFRLKKESLKN